jgi:BNR/Asp-box repeat
MGTYIWLAIMSRTTDGGRTWRRLPAPADHVDGIQFFTARDGLAWGPGLYTTTDGGETWHDIKPSEPLQAVDAKDGIAWMIVSECLGQDACHLELRISHDYGKTWFDSLSLHDFATPDVADGVMWLIERTCVPQQTPQCISKLRISRDKGRSWGYANLQVPIQGSDYQLLRANTTDAWILSRDTVQFDSEDHFGQYKHYLISTGDGGRSWQVRSQPCPASMTGRGVGLPGGYIWLLCTGRFDQGVAQPKELYVSSDWGSHWDLRANSRSPNQKRGAWSLEYRYGVATFGAISPKVAWMIYSEYLSEITFDGGYTWVGTGVTDGGGGGMGPVVFIDSKHAWFGSRGAIYYSEDGGHTWTAVGLNVYP